VVFSLTSCTSANPDYVGKWVAESASMGDKNVDLSILFSEEVSLELKEDGICTMSMGGKAGNAKWTCVNGALTISEGSDEGEITGTIENGKLTLVNVMDRGFDLIFKKQ